MSTTRSGMGFLKKFMKMPFENAIRVDLTKAGFVVKQQSPISVHFEGEIVGEYFADLLVNNVVVIELKAAQSIASEHEAQLLNYLKATGREVGLLLNFGPKAEFRRKVFTHS